ncbi:hypothetical protein [Sinomonas halotolerans]|uniref:Uncharacterized protein n=1 Tax=Sinomonas halotolerans TaxID=1644133 RepID=A0ABU9X2V1_9MICC
MAVADEQAGAGGRAPEGQEGGGWAASRVLVPGTAAQLGGLGLFVPPPGARTVVHADAAGGRAVDGGGPATDDAGLRALAAEPGLVWLGFDEVARAGAAGFDWAAAAGRHALWVVDGVPVLARAPKGAAGAFSGLMRVLRDADVALVVVARSDPGPLPVQTAEDAVLPRGARGS